MEYEDAKNCEIGFLISNIETKTCYIRGGDIFFDEVFLTVFWCCGKHKLIPSFKPTAFSAEAQWVAMTNLSDNHCLLIEALSGEKPNIISFIVKRTRNPAEAEDIYQEAMARLTRQLQLRDTPEQPTGYLYRIVMNIINDNIRNGQYSNYVEPITDDISSNAPSPEEQVGDQRRLALFAKHLNRLPSATRNMIVLKKLHGKSTVEISQLMGISEKSVEKKINRALRDIESKMSAYF